MSEPAERLQAQFDALFGHLPEDEVGEDEALAFNAAGAPQVHLGDRLYVLWGGSTWRYALEEGRGVFVEFRDRRQRRRVVDPAGDATLN